MKSSFFVSCLLLLVVSLNLLGLACSKTEQAPAQAPAQAATTAQQAPATGPDQPAVAAASDKVYVCEMGCEVADKPGKCSKCGMTLKEVPRSDVSYTCGVCGFTSDKPGVCPKDQTVLTFKIQEKKA